MLTISDGVAEGSRQDESGSLLMALLGKEGYEVERRVVPDDRDAIAEAIAELAEDVSVVLTTGGTRLGSQRRCARTRWRRRRTPCSRAGSPAFEARRWW